ncbi:MAG TPA: hypothetical protein DCY00_06780 [Actinobacteria bacterium]|nr:hypothetical protein [Actinomycetota bacterium]
MKIQIKNKKNKKIFSCEKNDLGKVITNYKNNLSYANLSRADLRGTDLKRAILIGTDLKGIDLSHTNLRCANLNGADLSYANLNGADLRGATLNHAILIGADLSYANLNGADLTDADLNCTILMGADLRGANLNGANLRCANLNGADLSYANLNGADLADADLSGTKGLIKAMGVEQGNIYWKRFEKGLCNNGYKFHVGINTLKKDEIFADDERILCSYPGFHFASKSWCELHYPRRPLEARIRIPNGAKINEPWATDGKASADIIEILQVFDVKTGKDVTEKYMKR